MKHSVSNQLYPESLLQAARQQTDPLADAVIAHVFEEYTFQQLNAWLKEITLNHSPLPESLPTVLREYFTQTSPLPAFANALQMRQGAGFFARHFQPVLSLLGSYSLPYCYAAADGAQVLWLSERIYRDTFKRLQETGQFILDVLDQNAFAPAGKGIRSIQKVRLMHAAVRFHIRKSGQWNPAWGEPINQEDMAGTQLAFSFIVLEGLTKLGFYYSSSEANAYMHLLKVIGAMLGVNEELLPSTTKEAYWLARRIGQRHFRKSEAGTGLTKALLACMQEVVPAALGPGFMASYVRYLVGNDVADLLEVPPADWSRAVINPLKAGNSLSSLFKQFGKNATYPVTDAMLWEMPANAAVFQLPAQLKTR